MANISTQDGIVGASTTADDARSYNIVSPDNGGSFSFCHIFDTLPTICGKQAPLTPIRKATTFAVVDDDHDDEEEILVATTVGTVNDYDETFQEQVPEDPIEPMDPMDVNSYISVCLSKPIGILFEENIPEYGGAAADGSIRRGYQLIAVGDKRVSGLDFDEAVIKPIVDKVEADVMLVFFKGTAECLYGSTSIVSEEWLDNFTAMQYSLYSMKRNVEVVVDIESGIEAVADTTDVVFEVVVTGDEVEDCEEETQSRSEVTEAGEEVEEKAIEEQQAEQADTADIAGEEFDADASYDFLTKFTDENTARLTPLPTFTWHPTVPDNEEPRDGEAAALFPSEANEEPRDDEVAILFPSEANEEGNAAAVGDARNAESNDYEDSPAEISVIGLPQEDIIVKEEVTNIDCSGDNMTESNGGSIALNSEGSREKEGQNDVEEAGNGSTDTSKVAHVDASYSPVAGFVVREHEEMPKVAEDEVLIKVDATSISTRDCLERLRRDKDEKLKDEPWVPGHEIVGRVVRAGTKVKVLQDRRVAALLSHGGGCARYVCISAKDLFTLPDAVSSREIVALLSMYMAAYQCLEFAKWQEDLFKGNASTACNAGKKKSPLSDKNICIVGAGGPVGLGIIDIATNAGARVYALSHSSYEKSLHEIGVNGWYPLFKKSKWVEAWGGKMDLIIDMIGDFNYYSCFSDVMAPKAKFVRVNTTSCGEKYVPGVEREKDKLSSVIRDYKGSRVNKVAIEYDVFHSFNDDQELFTEDLAYLHHLLEIGKIEPKLLSRVGFDELEQEWTKVMGGGGGG
ncbi:hypothetical protein ACHAWC_002474 [Mediolabrus comicus]